ncbi:hypothetical protein ACEPAF_9711 [Sanghuangporus sanghuang]
MSESVPKPKPRPRPRLRAVALSSEVEKPGSSSKSPPADEDAMFIRNRNRNASGWSKITQVVEKREAARAQSIDLSSSDSDSPRTKRIKRAPFTAKAKQLPAWAKSDGLIETSDSDAKSDNDVSTIGSIPLQDKASSHGSPNARIKRKSSVSSSDSSEPEVSVAEQIGRERARQILGAQPQRREKSPELLSDDDEGDDFGELPAELAAIKAEVKRNAVRANSVDNTASSLASIELKIVLKPHPKDETGRSYVYSHVMKRNEKFEQLFSEIADAGGIPSERLIVLFDNHRVYPWSTPQTLSIWSEAELVAYEEHVYKYIKAHEQRQSPADDFSAEPPPSSSAFSQSDILAEPGPSQDKADAFKLQIRCGQRTVVIGVRPTAKCAAIVENVLRKLGKPDSAAKAARIEVDGEKLSPESEIGEADLEEGDLIDIVGT